jgi:hypothetical protein
VLPMRQISRPSQNFAADYEILRDTSRGFERNNPNYIIIIWWSEEATPPPFDGQTYMGTGVIIKITNVIKVSCSGWGLLPPPPTAPLIGLTLLWFSPGESVFFSSGYLFCNKSVDGFDAICLSFNIV